MRQSLRVAVAAFCVLSACGQVEPVTMALSMPDCVYQGQNQMTEGEVSVSLSLNGIANASALLTEITDGHTHTELSDALRDAATVPGWARTVVELELSSSDALEGVEQTVTLEPGRYALLCLDDSGPRLATSLVVRDR